MKMSKKEITVTDEFVYVPVEKMGLFVGWRKYNVKLFSNSTLSKWMERNKLKSIGEVVLFLDYKNDR